MKKLLMLLGVLWGGGACGFWYWTDQRGQSVSYRTVAIKRGDLRSTINATGTLEPEEVVDVGAQVAGLIESFGTDPGELNEGRHVRHARRTKARCWHGSTVHFSRPAWTRRAAVLPKPRPTSSRPEPNSGRPSANWTGRRSCLPDEASPQQEYDTDLADHESAQATLSLNESELLVAEADLEEATVNLGYTTIRSPVKGVILDRRINIGQTVVASLNAPSLFLIAKDLSRLEIWASVNETDIGSIHEGQNVRFTVGTLPREEFAGKVAKIRLNASMSQNVVTYTVVIAVDNSSGRLLPYLTARIHFEVEKRERVLLVPSAALRWRPHAQDVVPEERGAFAARRARQPPENGEAGRPASTSADDGTGVLWIRQSDFVSPLHVVVGLSDGISTEVSGDGLTEGALIVVGANRADSDPDALSILPHARSGWQRSRSGHGAEPLLYQSEERWNKKDVDGTRQQHATDYGGAHDLAGH